MIRADGVAISMNYDAAKRLVRRDVGDEDTFLYSYNGRDELVGASNNTGSISLSYDEFGRVISETVNSQLTEFQYNIEDEYTVIDSLGVLQSQQYDVRGLLSELTANGVNYNYSYDAITRWNSITRESVNNSSLQYDQANQLISIDHGQGLRSYQYQYDLASRITQWQGVADEARTYSYDEVGRLTSIQSSNPESYGYDAMGNRTNLNAQFDGANQILEDDNFTFVYDVHGNRTQKTNKAEGAVEGYTYNGLDQLVRYQRFADSNPNATAETDVSYVYGPLGRRWFKQSNLNSERTDFFWAGFDLIGRSNETVLRRYILEGTTPVGFVESGASYHYFRDHLGVAHEVTDSTGNLVWQGNYVGFGETQEVLTIVANNIRFPGQYFDEESGLYYNFYRDYDPSLGRYLQRDPIGLLGGINTYNYTDSNPINRIDPTGELWKLVIECGKKPKACATFVKETCKHVWKWVKGPKPKKPEDIIKKSKPGRETKGKTNQRTKEGGNDQANSDFDSMKPNDVKDIETQYGPGRTGKLDSGESVTTRPGSSDGRPTLEIRRPNGRGTEIRYD